MEKVAPSRSPMTVYGRPNNALADDEAPAMSVPSLSVCLLTSLPLTFFLLSLFLPPLFLSPHGFLTPSCLLPFLSLCFFSQHISLSYHGFVHFTTIPTALPRVSPSTYSIYHWEFSSPCLSTILPSLFPSSLHTYWIENQHTHTPVNRTVVRFCLWQRKAISRLFQSSVITWSVSLSGACFIRLGPWLKPFWETENIISYDLLWYKSKLSAVNPIHNYSSL